MTSSIKAAADKLAEREVYLARTPDGDLVFGRDGSKWRHGWVPLNAVAAAMKAKRWKGGGSLPSGVRRPAGKGRAEGIELPGTGRPKRAKSVLSAEKRGSPGEEPRTRAQEINNMASNRAAIEAEFKKEWGSERTTIQHPMPDGATKSQVENKIREERGIAGMDRVDLERAEGKYSGWLHTIYPPYGAPAQHHFYPDQSSMDKARIGAEQSAKEAAAHAKLEGHNKAALKKYGYASHGGTGEGYHHANGKTYVLNDKSPFAHGRSLALEQSGAHLGTISPRHDGQWNSITSEGQELPVTDLKKAMNGLIAARHVRDTEAARIKAETDERNARFKAEDEARRAAAKAAVDKAAREKEMRSAAFERSRAEGNRQRLFSAASKPKATKRDTPTMQAAREKLAQRESNAVNLEERGHKVGDLAPGQRVKFRASYGQNQATEVREGHVWHAASGEVHITSVHPETGKTQMFSQWAHKGRTSSGDSAHLRDTAKDKDDFEGLRNHAFRGGHATPIYDKSGHASVAGLMDAAETKMYERMSTDKLKAILANPASSASRKRFAQQALSARR